MARRILEDCSVEMGLLRREDSGEGCGSLSADLLNRGKLLVSPTITEARCRYWLQDRYLNAWLESPTETKANRDSFADIAQNSALVEQSQTVLNSYAEADWKGAASVLSKLLHGENAETKIRSIVDMGGGQGSLLRELDDSGLFHKTEEFVCVDRPEVVAAATSSSDLSAALSGVKNIRHEVGDIFDGPIRSADLYVMSRVLHDWSDAQAAVILKRMRVLSPEDARLVIIDRVSTPDQLHAFLSLHMYMLQGSYERSHEEWKNLFVSAGWQVNGREHFNGHEMYLLTKSHQETIDPAHQTLTAAVEKTQDVPTIRKIVITAGGLGTRMEPQSVVTPKALLPIVSRDTAFDAVELQPQKWGVRPALSHLLDQLQDPSHTVDQVCVVSTPWQIPLLRSFLKDYQQRQSSLGKKDLSYEIIPQCDSGGFGDAVLSARQFVEGEPFVVAMGDHVYSSKCLENLLAAYKQLILDHDWRTTALTGVTLCNESEVQSTGLLRKRQNSLYPLGSPWLVEDMVEKPSSGYDSFRVSCNGSSKFPSQLGLEVLPPSIMTYLQAEKEEIAPHVELDLRKVVRESVLGKNNLFGSLIDGSRLDIGNPGAYKKTLNVIASDASGAFLSPRQMPLAEVQERQEQDKVLLSLCKLQQEDSTRIPDTLRQMLFGDNDTSSSSSQIFVGSSPGRMDLMGGFADYSGSFAIQHPTRERVVALSVVENERNPRSTGMVRLAAIQIEDISKLPEAISKGDFIVQEKTFPTGELFNAYGRLKADTELRAALSKQFSLDGAAPDRWVTYLIGILHRACQHKFNVDEVTASTNFTIATISDLPWNAGLASSAAVEVATFISLGRALQLPSDVFEPVSVALECKNVENHVVGAQCGIMDQLAVIHPGDTRTTEQPLIGMQCRMPLVNPATFNLPLPEGLSVIAVESGVKRSTASTSYQRVRTGSIVGKAILEASLGEKIHHLSDVTPSTFALFEDHVPEFMTGREIAARFPGLLSRIEDYAVDDDDPPLYPVQEATRFPIEENLRVQMFKNVLWGNEASTFPTRSSLNVLGELMRQTHAGYSKCGLGTDPTDFLANSLNTATSAVGAKISGGGGGGAVVALVHDSFLQNSTPFEKLQERYHANTGLACSLRKGTSGAAKFHGSIRRQFSTSRVDADVEDSSLPPTRGKPRVLVVNHGYPPDFNGGSEVYAQAVALQLKKSERCESVHVFAREHDPYRPDFTVRRTADEIDSDLPVFRMNYSREAPYFRFVADEVDRVFEEIVAEVKPDIMHLHHMNHLSLNLPAIAKAAGARVVYTLHDFWLMCPRGQFLQTGPDGNDPWRLCSGQENSKCAKHCYTGRYGSGVYNGESDGDDGEQRYWTDWIASRMQETKKACEHIDLFVAPSQQLFNKFVTDFSLPAEKVIVEPYGFFRNRLVNKQNRQGISSNDGSSLDAVPPQKEDRPYVFAYIGRHQPGKGINLLVQASLELLQDTCTDSIEGGDARNIPFHVKIFGRQDANSSRSLQRMISEYPHPRAHEIFSWEAEYANKDIVDHVFNQVDCIVVPSIWEENSPLVIHEAQQCRIPVITAEFGGMGELVKNHVNGLTFEHRNANSLVSAMSKAIEQPQGMRYLGQRGYLYSSDGQIPCIQEHTDTLLQLFHTLLNVDDKNGIAKASCGSWYTAKYNELHAGGDIDKPKQQSSIRRLAAPWRVTFDTNPDDCNFSCTMCEQHSEFSPYQKERKAQGVRSRRMDFELIRQTVAELAPHGLQEIIPTTMGEPLMYKEFPKMLDLCREYGVKLNLTTNGSFQRRGAETWAEDIVPVSSDVKISWNGITKDTQEKIMKRSDLDTQITNLREFINVRNRHADAGGNYCSVTLQLTFMEINLEEIPQLVEFAIQEDCDRVKGHHLWAHFSEIMNENLRRSADSVRRWNAIAKECRDIAMSKKRPSGRPFRLENFNDLDESLSSHGVVDPDATCPFLGREAWVNHSGRFDPCCAPDEQRKKLGSFGNVAEPETSLLDIWNSDQYNDLVRNYSNLSLCKNCTMRRPVENE